MVFGTRGRIVILALLGAVLAAAQTFLIAHVHEHEHEQHFVEFAHHHGHDHEHERHQDDEPPTQDCGVCLIAASINDDAGPVPACSLTDHKEEVRSQSVKAGNTAKRTQTKYAGTSPRGPPA